MPIVSLGIACQPAHQIGRLFPEQQSHVLDWLITPHNGLLGLIRSNFEGFFRLDRLRKGFKDRVCDTLSGAQFIHEFSQGDDLNVKYELHRPRFEELITRWQDLRGAKQPLVFIRQSDRFNDASKAATEILNALDDAAFPQDTKLFYLTPTRPIATGSEYHGPEDTKRIHFRELRQCEPYVWSGDDAAWGDILSEVAPHIIPQQTTSSLK